MYFNSTLHKYFAALTLWRGLSKWLGRWSAVRWRCGLVCALPLVYSVHGVQKKVEIIRSKIWHYCNRTGTVKSESLLSCVSTSTGFGRQTGPAFFPNPVPPALHTSANFRRWSYYLYWIQDLPIKITIVWMHNIESIALI